MYDFSGFIFLLIMLPLLIVAVLHILLWLVKLFFEFLDRFFIFDSEEKEE